MQRIAIIGTSCSGKTTLAQRLARLLDARHIELDALNWDSGWRARPTPCFRDRVTDAIACERWVACGNYQQVRDLIWGRATTLIWLNYPFSIVVGRAFKRTVLRVARRQELYSGNRETFKRAFLSRDSILWWVIRSHHRRRREYRKLLDERPYPHLRQIELNHPIEAEALISEIARTVLIPCD